LGPASSRRAPTVIGLVRPIRLLAIRFGGVTLRMSRPRPPEEEEEEDPPPVSD